MSEERKRNQRSEKTTNGRKKERTDGQRRKGNKTKEKGTKQGQTRKQAKGTKTTKNNKKRTNEGKRSKRNESGTKGKETRTKREQGDRESMKWRERRKQFGGGVKNHLNCVQGSELAQQQHPPWGLSSRPQG